MENEWDFGPAPLLPRVTRTAVTWASAAPGLKLAQGTSPSPFPPAERGAWPESQQHTASCTGLVTKPRLSPTISTSELLQAKGEEGLTALSRALQVGGILLHCFVLLSLNAGHLSGHQSAFLSQRGLLSQRGIPGQHGSCKMARVQGGHGHADGFFAPEAHAGLVLQGKV